MANEYVFVNSYTQLGLLKIKQAQWEEAYATLQEAVRLGEKTKDAQKYTNALIVLGDWYQLRQRCALNQEQITAVERKPDLFVLQLV